MRDQNKKLVATLEGSEGKLTDVQSSLKVYRERNAELKMRLEKFQDVQSNPALNVDELKRESDDKFDETFAKDSNVNSSLIF